MVIVSKQRFALVFVIIWNFHSGPKKWNELLHLLISDLSMMFSGYSEETDRF